MVDALGAYSPSRQLPTRAHVALLGVMCWLSALLGATPVRAQSLVAKVPPLVVADPSQPVVIPLAASNGGSIPAPRVRVSTNAGAVVVQATGDGGSELVFTPPHLVEKRTVLMDVTVPGLVPSKTSLRVRVVPPSRPLTYRVVSGPLELKVPEQWVLGEHQLGTLFVRAEAEPLLVVNVGSVSRPQKHEPGVWAVTYKAPESRFPQRVLLAASSADGANLTFAQFDLLGRPEVETRTEPATFVRVKVGSVEFGPIQSDSRGRASLRLLVPPGVARVSLIATDATGNRRISDLPLGVQDFNRLLALCPDYTGRFILYGTDRAGKPLSRLDARLSTSAGSLEEPRLMEPGVFESEVRITEKTQAIRRVRFSAELVGSIGSRVECEAFGPGEPPTAVKLELVPRVFQPGGPPVRLQATLEYPGDKPPMPVTLAFSSSTGRISSESHPTVNQFLAEWQPATDTVPGSRVTISARVPRFPELHSEAILVVSQDGNGSTPPVAEATLLARAGLLTNFGQIQAPFAALAGERSVSARLPRLTLGLELGVYASNRMTTTESDQVNVKVTGTPVSLRFVYHAPAERLLPYAGGGFGVVFARTSVSSPTTGDTGGPRTVPLVRLLAGIAYQAEVGRLGMEAGYLHCPLQGGSASGNVCGLDASATYKWRF